jgi:hypothetical protein
MIGARDLVKGCYTADVTGGSGVPGLVRLDPEFASSVRRWADLEWRSRTLVVSSVSPIAHSRALAGSLVIDQYEDGGHDCMCRDQCSSRPLPLS